MKREKVASAKMAVEQWKRVKRAKQRWLCHGHRLPRRASGYGASRGALLFVFFR